MSRLCRGQAARAQIGFTMRPGERHGALFNLVDRLLVALGLSRVDLPLFRLPPPPLGLPLGVTTQTGVALIERLVARAVRTRGAVDPLDGVDEAAAGNALDERDHIPLEPADPAVTDPLVDVDGKAIVAAAHWAGSDPLGSAGFLEDDAEGSSHAEKVSVPGLLDPIIPGRLTS